MKYAIAYLAFEDEGLFIRKAGNKIKFEIEEGRSCSISANQFKELVNWAIREEFIKKEELSG